MNRTAARSRVRQLLAWMEQELVEGVCPQCGMVGEDMGTMPTEVHKEHAEKIGVPTSHPIRGLQFRHLLGCPLEDVADKLNPLVARHRMKIRAVPVKADRGWMRVLRLAEEDV